MRVSHRERERRENGGEKKHVCVCRPTTLVLVPCSFSFMSSTQSFTSSMPSLQQYKYYLIIVCCLATKRSCRTYVNMFLYKVHTSKRISIMSVHVQSSMYMRTNIYTCTCTCYLLLVTCDYTCYMSWYMQATGSCICT